MPLTDDAVEVSKTKNINSATLRVRVQQSRRAEIGSGLATSDTVAVAVRRSSEGCGEEESGDGEELHFGFVDDVKKDLQKE